MGRVPIGRVHGVFGHEYSTCWGILAFALGPRSCRGSQARPWTNPSQSSVFDLVTETDEAAEAVITTALNCVFPRPRRIAKRSGTRNPRCSTRSPMRFGIHRRSASTDAKLRVHSAAVRRHAGGDRPRRGRRRRDLRPDLPRLELRGPGGGAWPSRRTERAAPAGGRPARSPGWTA